MGKREEKNIPVHTFEVLAKIMEVGGWVYLNYLLMNHVKLVLLEVLDDN
jgi:hypothetical protein